MSTRARLRMAVKSMDATFRETDPVRALRIWRQTAQRRTMQLVAQRSRKPGSK